MRGKPFLARIRLNLREDAVAEIVNLNKFRKSSTRDAEKNRARENRVKFGRTKTEKENDLRASKRREKEIAGRELEPKDE